MFAISQANPRLIRVFTLFALFIFTNGFAYAGAGVASTEPLAIQLTMKKVVADAKGNEKLVEAPNVKPGDLIEYTATYRNRSKQAITGVNGSLPVPAGLEYVKQSAKPANALATADGSQFAAEPLTRKVKDKNGIEQTVEIPYAEYRSLRWDIGNLDAGKRSVVSARMRVAAPAPTPEALVSKPKTPAPLPIK